MLVSPRHMLPYAILSMCIVAILPVRAQSPFSTGDGSGSATIRDGGFVQANFAKDGFSMGYAFEDNGKADQIYQAGNGLRALASGPKYRPKDNSDPRNIAAMLDKVRPRDIPRWGLMLSAVPNEHTGSVIDRNGVSFGGSLGASFGLSNLVSYRLSASETNRRTLLVSLYGSDGQDSGIPSLLTLQNAVIREQQNVNKAEDALKDTGAVVDADIVSLQKANDTAAVTRSALSKASTAGEGAVATADYNDAVVAVQAAKHTLASDKDSFTVRQTDLVTAEQVYAETRKALAGRVGVIEYALVGTRLSPNAAPPPNGPVGALLNKLSLSDPAKKPDPSAIASLQNYQNPYDEAVLSAAISGGELPADGEEAKQVILERQRQLAATLKTGHDGIIFDRIDLQISTQKSRYKFLNTAAAFGTQISKRSFSGISAMLTYTLESSEKNTPVVFGLSGGSSRMNNTAKLDQVDFHDAIFTSTNGSGETHTADSVTKVYTGTFKEYTATVLNSDLAFSPPALGGQIAIDLFYRGSYHSGGSESKPGVALLVTQKGAPLKVIGGVSVYRSDKGDAAVDLVGGYNF